MYPSAVGVCVRCSLFLVLVQVLVQVLVLVRPSAGYSLDQDHSLEFSGPPSSMFGYSVLLHRHRTHNWLVVGAPVANSSSSPWVQSPGAVYRCNITAQSQRCDPMHADVQRCGKTCEAESDHQWLGVSLSRQPGDNGGHILACGHRWKNVFYSKKDNQNNKLPNGVCYRYGNDLRHGQPIIPCYRDHQRKFGEDYGSCQAGISNFLTEDLIIMGAPGTSYWTGSVLVFNTSSGGMSVYLDDDAGSVSFGSYLGYSVGAGHFLSPASVEVVGGAPQYNQRGKVFIFTVDNSMLRVVSEVSGTELGSYFGSSVCVVDLNADGLSDLLVGAPMATGVAREEGRVHVYINQGQAKLVEAEFQLTGSDAYAARFGETIADLGDLDDDGYNDVAVGAPQEDDLQGAVYIYNGRKEGISPTPSQRITGSTLGRNLRMFGQSLNSGIDIDDNGYQDVAVGAFLSDSAVVLRTRPVIQVKASLTLPEQIDQQVALCREHKTPTVCVNVTVCFSVKSRHFRGAIDLQYNLTSDLLHKPSFQHRFYFHGNGSSNSTRGRVRARHGQLTCTTHVAYQRKDVRDIFTPVQFEVSYSLRETNTHRTSSRTFPPLKPILQQSAGHQNTITNQTRFARSCHLVNCSTNMQLSAQLVLPHQQQYFALGSGETIMLKTTVLNSGDDAFLPRLTLHFPKNIHYIKVLQNQDNMVSCDVTEGINSTIVVVDCRITSFLLPAHAQLNISFLLDVNQNSTPGDINIQVNTISDNYEREEYLHDNSISLLLPLKYGVDINVHGFVTPTSFVFGDEDSTPVECYTERFNYTYKVLNSGPSRSVDTVVDIALPKILTPHRHRLLQVVDWQTSHGVCSISDTTISVIEDCDVPQASFIKQLIFFFSSASTRRMFCGRVDDVCERLVCHLGNLEAGRDATIQLETRLNPAVLLQAPGRHSIMMLETLAMISSPREDRHNILMQKQPAAQVVVEALFTQKPSMTVKVFIIVVSLVLGLMILAALIWCLWKAGFFKRDLQKKEEEFKRLSWDYVPKKSERESIS
ncbi:integrin alpha-4 isoform X1 [Xiphias gladius]|uniref:integrin alpha-4 isoform X1 n=1 Tax=Xiphias gladius TaxID=8245 RepID=UPI001A990640|nr:integrin alpha-4 isoform X1 [Xiphias gladius]XP_040003694.1 integrin alpha-4 isoform X1 [Xiphias gladius]XP_040003695.1 integrin alpha-4 isoform X1 [Xiphias gladius]XP_040003696.1 integrin alpha-4 isoform X1 [Xiphias gladius]